MRGYELRELMHKSHISQTEMAEILGVSYVTISRWTRGNKEIGEKYIPKINEVCASGLPETPLTGTEQRLLTGYRKLSAGKRRDILKRVEQETGTKGACDESTQS